MLIHGWKNYIQELQLAFKGSTSGLQLNSECQQFVTDVSHFY